MASILNFTEALMAAKRRAQLQGRPVSEQEVRGLTSGFAESAARTNLAEKQLETQTGQWEKGFTEQQKEFGQTLTAEKERQAAAIQAQKDLQAQSLSQQNTQFAQSLAQRKYETEQQIKAANEAMKSEERRAAASGTMTGAVMGGTAGYLGGAAAGASAGASAGSVYPIVGTAIGAVVGAAVGYFSSKCIIISACSWPDSYEVQLARAYRDEFMDEPTLLGYYCLCPVMVPLIHRFQGFRKLVKKILVDRLVDFGEFELGLTRKRKLWTSFFISKSFLGLCRIIGKSADMILEVAHG